MHYLQAMRNLFLIIFSLITCACYGQGKIQKQWPADSKGNKINKSSETHWNSQGDVIKRVEYTGGKEPFMLTYTFDYQAGRKTKRTDTRNREYTVYTYDKAGRLNGELLYDSRGRLEKKTVHVYNGNSKNISFTEEYDAGKSTPYMRSTFTYYPNGLLKKEVQTAGGSWFMTRDLKYDNNKHLIYEGNEADGGVGLVRYYYIYKGDVLVKDKVVIPATGTEYHVYEVKAQ